MKPSRPLTHDLFKNFALQFQINIVEVVISKFEEGIFYSKLVCEREGETVEIDSRTSDAIALALRFGCPIYALESIIDEAGILMSDLPGEESTEASQDEEILEADGVYEEFLLEELEEMLQKAIEEENYEEASRLRDEINRRKKKL